MYCEGWYKTFDHYGLVYKLPPHPPNFRCESLGNILLKEEYKELLHRDLNNRLQLAKALAWTLFELHTVQWVHQSFYPDNILLFGQELPSGAVQFDWSSPYVVGFDSSRSNTGVSGKLNFRGEWNSRLYTHPDRLLKEYERYHKIHDIYSLGVVLLDVGRLGSLMEDRQTEEWNRYGPHKVKDMFTKKAKSLQQVLGKNYCDVVMTCLNGLLDDRDDYTLMDEFRSQVCEKLDQIKIS
jgi:serine/threonine protein kinase